MIIWTQIAGTDDITARSARWRACPHGGVSAALERQWREEWQGLALLLPLFTHAQRPFTLSPARWRTAWSMREIRHINVQVALYRCASEMETLPADATPAGVLRRVRSPDGCVVRRIARAPNRRRSGNAFTACDGISFHWGNSIAIAWPGHGGERDDDSDCCQSIAVPNDTCNSSPCGENMVDNSSARSATGR